MKGMLGESPVQFKSVDLTPGGVAVREDSAMTAAFKAAVE